MTTKLNLADLGRALTPAEEQAYQRYLQSRDNGSAPVDAAQHAIAQMLRVDVTYDFVTWLGARKLRLLVGGRVTRMPRHNTVLKQILSPDEVAR